MLVEEMEVDWDQREWGIFIRSLLQLFKHSL